MKFVEPFYNTASKQVNAKVHVSLDGETTVCGRPFIAMWQKRTFQDFLLFGCKTCRSIVFKDATEPESNFDYCPDCGTVVYRGKTK